MLLEHTSGLPRYIFNPAVSEAVNRDRDKVWTNEERLSMAFEMEALHEAGESWGYSDTNYILIGMLIEKITGENYYELVRKRVLDPLDLKHTYPLVSRNIINASNAYSTKENLFKTPTVLFENDLYYFNPQLEWTGGGFYCTTEDLAKWAKHFYTSAAFSEESLNYIITPNKNAEKIGEGVAYGAGSFILETRYGIAYAHSGTMAGFKSIFAYFPDLDVAVALQTNCDYAQRKIKLINYLEEIFDSIEFKNNGK